MVLVRLFGLAVLCLIIYRLRDAPWEAIVRETNPWWLVFAMFLNLPQLGMRALRWRSLLARRGGRYSIGEATEVYLSAAFLGILTPGRVGEIVRANYAVRDTGISYRAALASVILDRAADVYLFSVVGLIGFLHFKVPTVAPVFLSAFVGAALTLPLFLIILSGDRAGKLGFQRIVPWSFSDREQVVRLSVGGIYRTLAATGAVHGIVYVQSYCISLSLGIADALNFVETALVVALATIVALVPVSFAGIGTRDLVAIELLSRRGLDEALAVLFSALVLAIFYGGTGLWGGLAYLRKPPGIGGVIPEELKHSADSISTSASHGSQASSRSGERD